MSNQPASDASEVPSLNTSTQSVPAQLISFSATPDGPAAATDAVAPSARITSKHAWDNRRRAPANHFPADER